MNNELNPDVKAMRDAEDDAARAAVLLSAPVFTLMRWKDVFRRHCRKAAFDDGEAYLDALTDALSSRCHLGNFGSSALGAARIRLVYVADPGRPAEESET